MKVAQSCPTLCNPHGLYSPWNSPCWNTGVGNLSVLQNASMRVRMKTQIHGSMSNTLKKKKKKKCLAKRKVLQYFRGNVPLKLTLSLYCQPYTTWPRPHSKLIYIKLFQDCNTLVIQYCLYFYRSIGGKKVYTQLYATF